MRQKVPTAPRGCGPAGRRLWRDLHAKCRFDVHETALVERVCRIQDVVSTLQATVDADGPLIATATGEQRVHPALVELRQQSQLLARLIVALKLPDDTGRKPQHRGVRGVYPIKEAHRA